MKKLAVILTLALLVVAILPTVCFANNTLSNGEDVYLANPISTAVHQDLLFVADNITESASLLHIFDIANAPKLLQSLQLDGTVNSLKVDGDTLFVIFSKKFSQYTIDSQTLTNPTTYDVPNVADVMYRDSNIIALTTNGTLTNSSNANLKVDFDGQGLACTKIGDTYYWMYNRENLSAYTTATWDEQGFFSFGNEVVLDNKFDGMTVANSTLLFYNQTVVLDSTNHTYIYTEVDNPFVNVTSDNNRLFAIVSKSVVIYNYDNGNFIKSANTIGSDTVKLDTPSIDDINSYTLVTPKSYPATIIYKTTDADTSVTNIIDDANNQSYVILGYQGDQDDDYYYVLINDKFGWVRKSADAVEEDSNLTVVNTAISTDYAHFYGQFVSANAIYLYNLPVSTQASAQHSLITVNQTANNPIVVKLLQEFTAYDGTQWFWVEFDWQNAKMRGFVNQSHVGKINVSNGPAQTVLDSENPYMKINASLSDSVCLYATKGLLENTRVTDDDGNEVRLETNTKVGIITRLEDVSYLQVVYADGTTYYGWVENRYLIGLNSLTTNTVVGISFISLATVLIVSTVAVIRKRQIKNQQNKSEAE